MKRLDKAMENELSKELRSYTEAYEKANGKAPSMAELSNKYDSIVARLERNQKLMYASY